MKKIFTICIALLLLISLSYAGGTKEETEEGKTEGVEASMPGTPQAGGTLKVAIEGEPSGLDTMAQTGTQMMRAVWSTQECLVEWDENYQIRLELAEKLDWSSDGKVITFHLRKGVPFHNGKEMTAEDVLASWERAREMPISSTKFSHVAGMELVDKYTFMVTLKRPTPTFLEIVASRVGAIPILPKEIAESTPAGKLTADKVIGTGPYKLAEWRKGSYVKLVRFEDYVGDKKQYLDEILLIPVTEVSARLSGVLAGDYHIALNVPVENYSQILKNPGVEALKDPEGASHGMFLNHAKYPLNNRKIRQAMLAALKMDEILMGVVGEESFFSLDSSWVGAEGSVFQTDMGTKLGLFNENDPEKAKRLLKEAGYNNEPLILMPIIRKDMMSAALVVYEQLKAVGFNVVLTPYDNAVVREVRGNPEKWDIYFSGIRNCSDPYSLAMFFNPNGYMHYGNAEIDELWQQMLEEPDLQKRIDIWKKIETIIYEDVPFIKYGNHYTMHVASKKVGGWKKGEDRATTDLFFHECWISK